MEAVISGARRVAHWGLWFGGALILLAAILIGIDVVMRKFFNASIGGADELAGYALALGTAWSLAAALLDRAHIRIDSLYVLFPRRLRFALDIVGLVLFIAFFALIAWHGWIVVAQSWSSGSRSQSALQTPTVIPQFIWFVGLAGFVAIGIVLLARAMVLATRGEHAAVAKAISTRSAEEEVADEIRDLLERNSRKDVL
jgi:TRAP-type C4-dicarboxylate transport system permease small subunit